MKIKKIIKNTIKSIIITGVCLAIAGTAALFGINAYVKNSVDERIITAEELSDYGADCILVLGCYVRPGGEPSHMLRDRLQRGVELYEMDAADKLLMSGDHGRTNYNEVETMKQYAIDAGIKSQAVFMDHAGFSTYESMYRAKEVFGVEKMVIVTQEYHLYRALYIANSMGIEAYGVPADFNTYAGQGARDAREVLARTKDFATTIFKTKPTYLGDFIDIHGDGDVTND